MNGKSVGAGVQVRDYRLPACEAGRHGSDRLRMQWSTIPGRAQEDGDAVARVHIRPDEQHIAVAVVDLQGPESSAKILGEVLVRGLEPAQRRGGEERALRHDACVRQPSGAPCRDLVHLELRDGDQLGFNAPLNSTSFDVVEPRPGGERDEEAGDQDSGCGSWEPGNRAAAGLS
jgi:hypothetical protein